MFHLTYLLLKMFIKLSTYREIFQLPEKRERVEICLLFLVFDSIRRR